MTTKAEWKTLPAGTKLRCVEGFVDSDDAARLIVGETYEFVKYAPGYSGAVVTKGCSLHPDLNAVNWGNGVNTDGSQHFEVIYPELRLDQQLNYFRALQAVYEESSVALANIEDELQAAGEALIIALEKEISR